MRRAINWFVVLLSGLFLLVGLMQSRHGGTSPGHDATGGDAAHYLPARTGAGEQPA
jgi:membrane-associated PAP2 superfamily phosphatase